MCIFLISCWFLSSETVSTFLFTYIHYACKYPQGWSSLVIFILVSEHYLYDLIGSSWAKLLNVCGLSQSKQLIAYH